MDNQECADLQKRLESHLGASVVPFPRGGVLRFIHKGNHLVWRGDYVDGAGFALRMADPTHYRAGEWISAQQEYALLKALEETGFTPKPHAMDHEFEQPFVMMEWVDGTPLNAISANDRERYLDAVARAIALLNRQDITPERFPFLMNRMYGAQRGNAARYLRLLDACRRTPRRDVVVWAARILPMVVKVHQILMKYNPLLAQQEWCFHHDGLHAGNVFIRREDDSPIFLDWDRVSYRLDPTYTIVRFATSLHVDGVVPVAMFARLMIRYLEVSDPPYFDSLAGARLLERMCADLVWVLWDFTRNPAHRGKKIPDRMHAALAARLRGVWEYYQLAEWRTRDPLFLRR